MRGGGLQRWPLDDDERRGALILFNKIESRTSGFPFTTMLDTPQSMEPRRGGRDLGAMVGRETSSLVVQTSRERGPPPEIRPRKSMMIIPENLAKREGGILGICPNLPPKELPAFF